MFSSLINQVKHDWNYRQKANAVEGFTPVSEKERSRMQCFLRIEHELLCLTITRSRVALCGNWQVS